MRGNPSGDGRYASEASRGGRFTRLFGGRDRLARRFLGEEGEPVALALIR